MATPKTSPKTSERILDIARDLLAADGLAAVSFDAIAARLGKSKQAVLYWYPSKNDLLAAMYLPWLEAETGIAERSLAGVRGRDDAIGSFVRAIAGFHLGSLDRFRMMYLVPQTLRPGAQGHMNEALVRQVHPVTDRLYAALAAHLPGGRAAARQQAVAIHAAVLGQVLMIALADGLNDPLKHPPADLIDALIDALRAR